METEARGRRKSGHASKQDCIEKCATRDKRQRGSKTNHTLDDSVQTVKGILDVDVD